MLAQNLYEYLNRPMSQPSNHCSDNHGILQVKRLDELNVIHGRRDQSGSSNPHCRDRSLRIHGFQQATTKQRPMLIQIAI